jgi:hypothetical protein
MLTTDSSAVTDCQEYRHTDVSARSIPHVSVEALPEPAPADPHFHLIAIDSEDDDGEEDVDLLIRIPEAPNINLHASLALTYGLAIMTLDQDGTIKRRIDELLAAGPINEVDACNQINLLLLKEANDQRI